jgi:hypothetical protein
MEEIDNAIGTELANSAFHGRAAFFGLFAAVYDLVVGIGSPLKRQKAGHLPSDAKVRALKASDAIQAGKAPIKVMEALARRTTHKESRQVVVDYLTAQLSHA